MTEADPARPVVVPLPGSVPAPDLNLPAPGAPAAVGRYEALARAWLPRVYGAALALTGRAAEAEDLAQDAFLRAFREHGTLRDPAAFGPWVLRILRNAWTDRLRRGRRERALDEPETVEARAGGSGGWEEATVAGWRRLPEEERLVCWLKVVVGVPFREIAVLLSTSKSAVDRTFRRALDRLRGDTA
jgi:RNA polymerase sigma factor (sigma-70 family)